MNKLLVAPKGLLLPPYEQNFIKLKGFTVVEACTYQAGTKGSMFLDDHLILVVLKGTYIISHEGNRYILGKNEMVLLKKAITIEYEKTGDPSAGNIFEYMMFFLKDDFLKEFVKTLRNPRKPEDAMVPVSVICADSRLLGFIESLKPYLNEKGGVDENLLKLKMFELLYDIGNVDSNLLQQLLQLGHQSRQNINYVLENNFMNPVTVEDLAYLSGRSLSGFKRDFSAIYKIPPSQWLRERRLARAKELLETTEKTVTDICFEAGFENISHFSRLFKEYYGHTPSSYRKE